MHSQCLNGKCWKQNTSVALLRLRFRLYYTAFHIDERALYRDHSRAQIDIAPLEPEHLATALFAVGWFDQLTMVVSHIIDFMGNTVVFHCAIFKRGKRRVETDVGPQGKFSPGDGSC
jgi:hypothetical protein